MHTLAGHQLTHRAAPALENTNPSSLVGNRRFPHLDMEWQQWQELDVAEPWERERQREAEAFMSHLDSERRERQTREDAERQERQRQRREDADRQERRNSRNAELEMKRLEVEALRLSQRSRRDDSPPRYRLPSRPVEPRR